MNEQLPTYTGGEDNLPPYQIIVIRDEGERMFQETKDSCGKLCSEIWTIAGCTLLVIGVIYLTEYTRNNVF